MKWEMIKLGEIIEFSNGINFDKSSYANGIKFISVSDFGNRFFPQYDDLSEVKKDVVSANDFLQEGDIVFVRSNGNKELVGRCMLIKDLPEPVTYSGFVIRGRIADHSKYDPVFLTYYFKSKAFRHKMSGTAVGANIQNLSQGRLTAYTARIPDFYSQRLIADILSAYDDLIENNQKQIKLLEEAAQRLYKEWFIDLRFPGHENTPIHNGVPEGWKMGFLGQLSEFKRGQTITKAEVQNGIIPVVAGGLEPAYYHNIANTSAPVITVSGSGANAGFTRMYHVNVFASDCSFADYNSTPFLEYVYCVLIEKKKDLRSMQKGSAQPHVYAKDINRLPVFIPNKKLLESFCEVTKQFYEQSSFLEKQIIKLTEARDRLLPKLMSGELKI